MTRPDSGRIEPRHAEQSHRLSPWMILVRPVEMVPSLIPIVIAVFLSGRASPLLGVAIGAAAIPLITIVPWLTTRYQVTDERVTVVSGIFTRRTASAPRDRIRSVELSATLAHRVLKLAKVRIGTGGDASSTVVELNAISAPAAARLRAELISPRSAAEPDHAVDAVSAPAESAVLTRFQLSWLRFAPFSLAGFVAAGAIVGVGAQLVNDLDLSERGVDVAVGVADRFSSSPAPVIVVAVGCVVLIATLLSLIGYVFSYWNFSVTRTTTPTGRSLHITRGLLTTYSTSLDDERVHGVQLHEPVLMRPVRGAKLSAIATGSDKHPLLLPPAPHAEAVRVAQAVSGDAVQLSEQLPPHGRAARRRRLMRAGLSAGVVVLGAMVGVAFAPAWWPLLPAALIVGAGLTALGEVRYRHLGTEATPSSVVFAAPTVARQRRVVHRDGVIGAVSRQTFFQRRAGVSTLVVATAAGSQAYPAIDLTDDAATAFLAELLPDEVASVRRNER